MLEESLTRSEKLRLWRRRRGWEQTTAALYFGVSERMYRNWESGKGRVPEVSLRGLEIHERYVVLRWRAKLTIRELSQLMGVCKEFVLDAERGYDIGLERFMHFWGD